MLGDFSAEDRKEIVRQIILWNRSYVARNPRIGLLLRLLSARRDVRETIQESFAEMDCLLKDAAINEKWGGIARSHMAQLRSIFDTHSEKQEEVCFDHLDIASFRDNVHICTCQFTIVVRADSQAGAYRMWKMPDAGRHHPESFGPEVPCMP